MDSCHYRVLSAKMAAGWLCRDLGRGVCGVLNLQYHLESFRGYPPSWNIETSLFLVLVEVAEARSPPPYTMAVGSPEKKSKKNKTQVVVVQAAERKRSGGVKRV